MKSITHFPRESQDGLFRWTGQNQQEYKSSIIKSTQSCTTPANTLAFCSRATYEDPNVICLYIRPQVSAICDGVLSTRCSCFI